MECRGSTCIIRSAGGLLGSLGMQGENSDLLSTWGVQVLGSKGVPYVECYKEILDCDSISFPLPWILARH